MLIEFSRFIQSAYWLPTQSHIPRNQIEVKRKEKEEEVEEKVEEEKKPSPDRRVPDRLIIDGV